MPAPASCPRSCGTISFGWTAAAAGVFGAIFPTGICPGRIWGLDLTAIVAARCCLMGAQLHRTVLAMADFSFADLRDARLAHADLRGTNLTRACLSGADLRRANLAALVSTHRPGRRWATSLESARLIGTDLRGANLRNVKLTGADLSHANIEGADLADAVLDQCVLPRISTARPFLGTVSSIGTEV